MSDPKPGDRFTVEYPPVTTDDAKQDDLLSDLRRTHDGDEAMERLRKALGRQGDAIRRKNLLGMI